MITDIAERGWFPQAAVRWGIRRLVRQRESEELLRLADGRLPVLRRWIEEMRGSPVALATDEANEQHYEVPAAFFQACLGAQLKYSSAFYPEGTETLDEAETAMLDLTAANAELEDGQNVLELGCGWGSLSLYMAERYRNSQITSVSNSASQKSFIDGQAATRGLSNLAVLTADMNTFTAPAGREYDRVVSVEMFEHMRNWESLLNRIHPWLRQEGKLFLHVFSHPEFFYPYETEGEDNWMGRHFFTGGMMPTHDILDHLEIPFTVEATLPLSGRHYAQTALHWHENLIARRSHIIDVLTTTYGSSEAHRWFNRWSLFFLACHELFAHKAGRSWQLAHHRLVK